MAWKPIDKTEKIVAGVAYRSTYKFRMPWSQLLQSTAVAAAWNARHALSLVGIKVEGVSGVPPSGTQQVAGARYQLWSIVVRWRRA